MSIKSVSTQINTQQIDATHFLQVASFPANVMTIEGKCGGTVNTVYYLQLHIGTPVSATTLPIWSMPVTGGLGFSFVYSPVGISTAAMGQQSPTVAQGLVTGVLNVAISSTNTVYTSVAAASDVRVDFEETEIELNNVIVVGDLTTNVGSLAVWSTGSTQYEILKIVAKNNNGATQYLQLFSTTAAPAAGTKPIQVWTAIAGQTLTLNFGRGQFVNSQTAAMVATTGCFLQISSTLPTLTAVANGWTLQAFVLDTSL